MAQKEREKMRRIRRTTSMGGNNGRRSKERPSENHRNGNHQEQTKGF